MIAAKLYRWSIDRINGRFVSGWCFNRLFKNRPVSMIAVADDTIVGRFTNDRYRPDLAAKKLHPSGVCGFDFSFPDDFDPSNCSRFHLYVDSFRQPLASIDCETIVNRRPRLAAPVCFMHIPKTAGTSFNAFARTCFSSDRFVTHLERLGNDQQRQAIGRALYLSGHLPLYKLSQLVALEDYDCFAIIREPYSHLHSHLNYLRGVDPGARVEHHYTYHHNQVVKTFSAYLNQVDFSDPGEIRTFISQLEGYQLDFLDNIQTRYFLDYRPATVGPDDLDRACHNIALFRAVGLTEAYDRFREQFCDIIGVNDGKQALRSNRSPEYRLFDLSDQSVCQALHPLVDYDMRLYEFVSARVMNS
jgi:hypothetical protein